MREPGTAHRSLRAGYLTAFLVFLAGSAIFLAFYGSATCFFQDESYVVWLAEPGLRHIAQYIPYEPHPPLYHAILSVWMMLAGDSERSVRALSGVFYLFALVAIARMGRTLFRWDELIVILVVITCCPVLLQATDYARMFTLLFFESCVALLSFSSLFLKRTARSTGTVVLLAVANLAGMLTHYYFAFVIIAEGVTFLVFVRRHWLIAALALVLPGIVFLALWGPHLLAQLRTERFAGNLVAPFPSATSEIYGYFGKRWIFVLLWLITLFLVSLSVRRFERRRWPALKTHVVFLLRDRQLQAFVIIWGTIFTGPFLAATVAGIAFWKGGMTYLPTLLPLAIVLALSVRGGSLELKLALAALVLSITVAAQMRSRNLNHVLNSDTRASIQLLKDKASDGDIIVALDNYITLFYYYMERAPGGKHVAVLAYPPDLAIHPGWYNEGRTLMDRDVYIAATRAFASVQANKLAGHRSQRLWLINTSWNPETNRIVTGVFDSALRRVDSVVVTGGTGYSQYIAYEAQR